MPDHDDVLPAARRPLPRSTAAALALVVVVLAGGVAAVAARGNGEHRVSTARGAAPSTTAATAAPSPAPSTAVAPPPPTEPPNPALTGQIDQIKAQVSELRGLPWKGPLDLAVVSRDVLAQRLREVIARDERPDRIASDGTLLKLLQLIPKDMDYKKAVDDLYVGQVIGFYDPKTKKLYVGNEGTGTLPPSTRITIAHELDHALTDQHFNFGGRSDELDNQDRQEELTAMTGLLEGDAKIMEDLWSTKYLSARERLQSAAGGGGTSLSRVPRYLKDSLYFPYTSGRRFTDAQYRNGGYAGVDAAYRNPPASTEVILHPERYPAQNPWARPAMPDVAKASGCAPERSGTFGEFDMEEILEEHLDDSAAGAAAQAWNGDVFTLVRCGSAHAVADRWDAGTPGDAARLTAALAQWARSWSGGNAPGADGKFSGPGGAGRLVESGTRIDLVLADDQPTADRISAAMA